MAAQNETTSEYSLIIENGKYFVEIPNKKGENVRRPILSNMIGFDKSLAKNGDTILVTMKNGIIQSQSVKLKGHEDYTPTESSTPQNPQSYGGRNSWGNHSSNFGRNSFGRNPNQITSKLESPSNIGQPFHNPYTFIPFSGTPQHIEPTLRTIDEVEKDRLSGVLELSVETLRPLLTMQAVKKNDTNKEKEKSSTALKIGSDVIVPATAIRGMLRNLMMILTSGSLGNTNPNAWFCCGRDVQLGDGTGRTPQTPQTLFLARVERAGNTLQDGIVRIGKCQLVPLEYLGDRNSLKKLRKDFKRGPLYYVYENGRPRPFDNRRDAGKTRWQLKISGDIQCKGRKKEALYAEDPTQSEITVPSSLWADYISRNTNGDHTELHRGDLIWLEPQNLNTTRITDGSQIKSLQWARWGKKGQAIQDVLPNKEYLPDTRRTDRKVDFVTNLFGQVSDTGDKNVPCFAGRIRPENLVFCDASAKIWKEIPLVALSTPHPGCFSFYQKKDEAKLRGYKVYRNAFDSEKPWEYDQQPIYDNNGRALGFDMVTKMTSAADLLPPNQTGNLRIAFQALTACELALLCRACSVNAWRLGGGKPIGLGLCQPEIKSIFILEDDGTIRTAKPEEFQLDEPLRSTVEKQTAIWEATQKPVSRVRYPRAAKKNYDSFQRGGHIWFSTFAAPKKGASGQMERQLQPVRFTESFRRSKGLPTDSQAMEGQWLPLFDPANPEADLLYGWNTKLEPLGAGNVKSYDSFKPFDKSDALSPDTKHIHENNSMNREKRQDNKDTRLDTEDES